jgi:hypothetical protein
MLANYNQKHLNQILFTCLGSLIVLNSWDWSKISSDGGDCDRWPSRHVIESYVDAPYQHEGSWNKTRTHSDVVGARLCVTHNVCKTSSGIVIPSSHHPSVHKIIPWSFLYDRWQILESKAPWHRGFFSCHGVSSH